MRAFYGERSHGLRGQERREKCGASSRVRIGCGHRKLDLAIGGGGNRLAVGDEKDGGFLFASEAGDEFDDGVTGGGVEIAGGFVGEKNRGLVDEGAGDGGALKLSAGELVGAVVGAIGELDGSEEVAGAGTGEGIDPT